MILVSGQARHRVLNLLSQAQPSGSSTSLSVRSWSLRVRTTSPAEGGSAPSNEPQVGGISFFRHRSGLLAYLVAYARA